MLSKLGEKMDEITQAVVGASGGVSASKATAMVGTGAGILSALMVMVFLEPQSKKEKFLCFACTFLFAICLSAAIKVYFKIELPNSLDGHLTYAGLVIASGTPGFVIVRAVFITLEKMKGKDIGQIIKMVRSWFGK